MHLTSKINAQHIYMLYMLVSYKKLQQKMILHAILKSGTNATVNI